MTLYITHDNNGNKIFLHGDLGSHCADCPDVSDNLCDYPVGDNKTCDRHICVEHSHEVAPNIHYCRSHFKEWNDFRMAGGVIKELKNVIAYRK